MNPMKKLLVIALVLCASSVWAVGTTTVDLGTGAIKGVVFYAQQGANNVVPAAPGIAGSFSVEIYDPLNCFDGLSTFTAPVSGLYKLTTTAMYNYGGSPNYCQVTILHNGVDVGYCQIANTNSNGAAPFVTVILYMAAGSKASVLQAQNTGAASSYGSATSARSYFMGELLVAR